MKPVWRRIPPLRDVKCAARSALQSCARLRRLFCRTHELESVDDLFAVRMLVNLASGSVGEFVLVVCRNRITEHQHVNDPDCTWLHCLPPPPIDPHKERHAHTVPIVAESRSKHTAQTAHVHRENYVAHIFVRQAPAWRPLRSGRCEDRTEKRLRGGETKKEAALSPPQRETARCSARLRASFQARTRNARTINPVP